MEAAKLSFEVSLIAMEGEEVKTDKTFQSAMEPAMAWRQVVIELLKGRTVHIAMTEPGEDGGGSEATAKRA